MSLINSSTSYTNVFTNHLILPSINPFLEIELTSDTTLAWSNDFGNNSLVVSNIMDISPNTSGLKVILPDATRAGNGSSFSINNKTLFDFDLVANDGATLITIIKKASFTTVYLRRNDTSNGTWDAVNAFGNPGITSIELLSSSPDLTISATSNPITSAGTFTIGLAGDLRALTMLGNNTGYATHIAPNTWAVRRMITSTKNQFVIGNEDGVNGNTTFELNPNLIGTAALSQLQVGNIAICVDGNNTISSANVNGDIVLNPNGNGTIIADKNLLVANGNKLFLQDAAGGLNKIGLYSQGITPSDYNIILPIKIGAPNQILRVSNSSVAPNSQLEWATLPTLPGTSVANTIAIYTDTTGSLGDSAVVISNTPGDGSIATGIRNNMSDIKSIGVGNLALGRSDDNTISSTDTGGHIILSPNGTGAVISTSDILIQIKSLILEDISANKIGIKAPASITTDFNIALPTSIGAVGDALIASNVSGSDISLTWAPPGIPQWFDITSGPVSMVHGVGYVCNTTILLILNMPSTVPFGAIIEVAGYNTGKWKIQLSPGQVAARSTAGGGATSTGGSITANDRYDSVRLLCTVANVQFTVISSNGTPAFA